MGNLDTFVLSRQLPYPPSYFQKEKFWFEDEPHDQSTDYDIEAALIVEGIGERQCPTIGKWAAFSIAGAIIAKLTGKFIIPPLPEPLDWSSNLEYHIWEVLWHMTQERKEGELDRIFLAAMLRNFLPREHWVPPDRPYRMSNFVSHWRVGKYVDTVFDSVGNLRISFIRGGHEAIERLSPTVAVSTREVAQFVHPMLKIAIQRISRTYRW